MTLRLAPVAAAVVLLVVGCGRAHLYYNTRELQHNVFQMSDKAALVAEIASRLEGKSLVWVDDQGHSSPIATTESGLKSLGLAELGAVWLVLASGEVGGEADVRVRVGKRPTPISVYVDLDGNVEVETGHNEKSDEPPLSEGQIRERFHLHVSLPGKWEVAERRALNDSLALLSEGELKVVRSIPFDRESKNSRNPGQAALYSQRGCAARIFLYPSGINSDRFRFVGTAQDPRSAVLHSLVHEIGHAVAAAQARALYCSAVHKPKQANALVGEANAMMARGPVVTAYLKVLDGAPAPTEYGNESAQESFAESFALFHVDPAALKRTRPQVFEWLARGEHLSSSGN